MFPDLIMTSIQLALMAVSGGYADGARDSGVGRPEKHKPIKILGVETNDWHFWKWLSLYLDRGFLVLVFIPYVSYRLHGAELLLPVGAISGACIVASYILWQYGELVYKDVGWPSFWLRLFNKIRGK